MGKVEQNCEACFTLIYEVVNKIIYIELFMQKNTEIYSCRRGKQIIIKLSKEQKE